MASRIDIDPVIARRNAIADWELSGDFFCQALSSLPDGAIAGYLIPDQLKVHSS